jgi:hypothetical protein
MTKPNPGPYLKRRQLLSPDAPGVYRLEYRFPEGGLWYFYLRFGVGQAGFVALTRMVVAPRAGGQDTFTLPMRRGLAPGIPTWVQPLGYAVFGLIATLATAGVALILHHLRQVIGQGAPHRPA